MTNQISAHRFELLTRKYHGFLESEFGFVLKKNKDWSFQAENNFVRVKVFTEYETLIVTLQPIKDGAKPFLQSNKFPVPQDVVNLMAKLYPNIEYKISWKNEKNVIMDISLELENRANILKNYLSNFLAGKFQEWTYFDGYH